MKVKLLIPFLLIACTGCAHSVGKDCQSVMNERMEMLKQSAYKQDGVEEVEAELYQTSRGYVSLLAIEAFDYNIIVRSKFPTYILVENYVGLVEQDYTFKACYDSRPLGLTERRKEKI